MLARPNSAGTSRPSSTAAASAASAEPLDLLTTAPDHTTGSGNARSAGVITIDADTGGANNTIALLPRAEYWILKDAAGTALTTDDLVSVALHLTLDAAALPSTSDDVSLVLFLLASADDSPDVATDEVSSIALRIAAPGQAGDTIAFGGGHDRISFSEGSNTTLNRQVKVDWTITGERLHRIDAWRKNTTAWQATAAKSVTGGQNLGTGKTLYIGMAYGHRDSVASAATLTLSSLTASAARLEPSA